MASVKKRSNGKWRARYRDPSGREHAAHFDRKVDAQRWLDEKTAAIVTGQYVTPDAGRVTFRAYAEQWRAAQMHRPSTAEKVEQMLRRHAYPAFGDRPLNSILPSEVQGWVKRLPLSPSTVAVVHGVVASVFKAAVADRRIVASPCEGTRLPSTEAAEVVPLPLQTVQAITEALPERLQAAATLAATTGLRQAEVFGLTVDRSGLQPPSAKPELRVDRQLVWLNRVGAHLGPPKRKASRRSVPLPQAAIAALAAHLAAFPPEPQRIACRDDAGRQWTEDAALLFTTEAGTPIRRSHFAERWRAAVAAADAPAGTTFHDLRHFYASLLIRHGESVKVVQARLGHATAAETLDTYSHLWPDSEDRTRAAVDSVLSAAADSVRTAEGR
jgi:integrase